MVYLRNLLRFSLTLAIGIFLLYVQNLYAFSSSGFRTSDKVRVLIKQSTRLFTVSSSASVSLFDMKKERFLFKDKKYEQCRFTVNGEGIIFNKEQTYCDKVRIIFKNGLMKTDDQLLEGEMILIRDGGRIQVINLVDVEKYLISVVSGELSDKAPIEALKAQAIASRTFAYDSMLRSQTREYDLDRYSQNYIGVCKGKFRIQEAVLSTQNEIMSLNGRLFTAFFHAACGGDTEYAGNVWKSATYPVSVKCSYCTEAKYYHWNAVISFEDIERKLSAKGYQLGKINRIVRHKISSVSQRITSFKIKGSAKELILRADMFRNIVGPDLLRSTNFKMQLKGNALSFDGFGWGHGVGMCQSGAEKMASLGWKYKKILEYYYPGIRFKTI